MKPGSQSPVKSPLKENINQKEPKTYWKRNFYFEFAFYSQNYWMSVPFSDPIQLYSLLQHKQVIISSLANRQLELQGPDFLYEQNCKPPYELLNLEQLDYFLNDLIEQNQFTLEEAKDFRYYLNIRKDWKNIFVQLAQQTNWRYHCELAFLFYKSIKITVEVISPWFRRSIEELKTLLQQYFSKNLNALKQRVPYFSNNPDFEQLTFKVIFTMMLSLYGIFVNSYCNRKSHLYYSLFSSIKQQERNCMKKKAKTANVKRGTRIGNTEQRAPEKRIKVLDQ